MGKRKKKRKTSFGENVEKLNLCILLVRMLNGIVGVENSMLIFQKYKHGRTL